MNITAVNRRASFGEGVLRGDARAYPSHKFLSFGYEVMLTICTTCGEVNSIRVEEPEKFK